MEPAVFRALCGLLWGDGFSWGAPGAAAFLHVSERTVKRWAEGSKVVGPDLAGELIAEFNRRLADPRDRSPSIAAVRLCTLGTVSA